MLKSEKVTISVVKTKEGNYGPWGSIKASDGRWYDVTGKQLPDVERYRANGTIVDIGYEVTKRGDKEFYKAKQFMETGQASPEAATKGKAGPNTVDGDVMRQKMMLLAYVKDMMVSGVMLTPQNGDPIEFWYEQTGKIWKLMHGAKKPEAPKPEAPPAPVTPPPAEAPPVPVDSDDIDVSKIPF
jgi:hypothetical protein